MTRQPLGADPGCPPQFVVPPDVKAMLIGDYRERDRTAPFGVKTRINGAQSQEFLDGFS